MSERSVVEMSKDDLMEEVLRLRAQVKAQQAAIARQVEVNSLLTDVTKTYYRDASDYVPLPEQDYE